MKTVEVVKDGVCGAVLGVLVTEVDVALGKLDDAVETTTLLVEADGDEVDTTTLLEGVVSTVVEGVATLVGVEVGVVEGLVAADELGTAALLVGLLTGDDAVVLVKPSEVEVPTLLVGVLLDKVEGGVEAD